MQENIDEESFAFSKMHGFSTVDGFVEITEDMAEMIKYVANEPSVGLFYVQQHTKNAVPNLINMKKNVEEKCRGMSLHTEDLEDSITMVRTMKECGVPIAEEMVRDIKKSISILSSKQPKKGLIRTSSSSTSSNKSFERGRSSSSNWGAAAWGRSSVFVQADGIGGSGGYLSTVIKSAKERASILKWPQLDSRQDNNSDKIVDVSDIIRNNNDNDEGNTSSSKMAAAIDDELPVSSREEEEEVEGRLLSSEKLVSSSSSSSSFDEYKADREAKLEEWLGGGTHVQGREY